MWDWAIYGGLIAGGLAFGGGLAFVGVRVLRALRDLKRLRRHVSKELDRLTELGEVTAAKAEAATDTSRLQRSLARLRVALARLAVLRAAVDEAEATVGRLTAVYPRK
ncbi:MAG: hypothetical protein ACYDBR_04285 [Gaiellaceae bacterium]